MKKIILLCFCVLLLFPFACMAKTVTFKEKYTYDASEADSKLTCRTISLLQVKRLLLEKLGTYIETKTEVANYQITKDEIAAFSAGIIKTEILEEKGIGRYQKGCGTWQWRCKAMAEIKRQINGDFSYFKIHGIFF